MFLDHLSTAVLQLCDSQHLTYERASERCDLSSRYISDIVRKKTAPTIRTLEKLCNGLEATPNELLLSENESIASQFSYRQPMSVLHICCFQKPDYVSVYPVCPRCGTSLEREYQNFCDRCGQKLDWSVFDSAKPIEIKK